MKSKLTQKLIDSAVCGSEKQFEYIMDGALQGFGVLITASGHKSYIVRYQFKGKRISKTIAPVHTLSLSAARERAKEIMAAYSLGQDPFESKKAERPKLTLQSLYEMWGKWAAERKIKRQAMLSCYYGLRKYFNLEKKIAESLTVQDLVGYQNARTKQNIKPSSINRNLRELKYLYTWGMAQGLISSEYEFPHVKKLSESMISPKIHHISENDIQKLIQEAMNTSKQKEYLRWIILFMLNTGIRPATVCGLRWDDVIRLNNDGGEIRLRAANIKTRKDVNLSISATAAEILQLLSQREHKPTDNIFTNCSPSTVNANIKQLMKTAGLPSELSAYSLRHNYATSLYLAGASPTEIQIQMCHSDYKTTQKYIHADFQHQKQVANKLQFKLKTKTA